MTDTLPTRDYRNFGIPDSDRMSVPLRSNVQYIIVGSAKRNARIMSVGEALGLFPIAASMRAISKAFARCKPIVMNREGIEMERHIVYDVFYNTYNMITDRRAENTAMTIDLQLRGNAYKLLDGNKAIYINNLGEVEITRDYKYKFDHARILGKELHGLVFDASEIVHIRNDSLDGVFGYSSLIQMKDMLGFYEDVVSYGGDYFHEGLLKGLLSTDGELTPNQITDIKNQWRTARNSGNEQTAVLGGGVRYQSIGASPEESQFIETRRQSATEIGACFGIPPLHFNNFERTSFANANIQAQSFINQAIIPSTDMYSSAFEKLLRPGEYIIWDISKAVEGSRKELAEILKIASPWMTRQEQRKEFGLPEESDEEVMNEVYNILRKEGNYA